MTDVYVANKGEEPETKPIEPIKPETDVPMTPKQAAIKESVRKTPADIRQLVTTILDRSGETPGKSVGGAYMVRPESRFINEQDDEEVVLMLRSHPIINLGWIVSLVFILLILEVLVGSGMLNNMPGKFVFVGRLVIYLFALGFAFQKFLDWYYSVLIVTNERIINVDFVNLLYRVVTYAELNHIEEPSMVAGGLFRSFFRFGDIYIETAAETPNIEARAIPYPDRAIKIISELSEELEKRRELGQ